jgi:long-chain fatty acid transport protein
VNKDLAVGLGSFSYFGGMLNYNDDWVGRYFVRDITLAGLTVMPSVAYRINDKISIGAGLNAMYGMLEDKKAVHNLAAEGDGQLKVKDDTWGFGADVGVLFEPVKGSRIGITYISQVNLDFKDTRQGTGDSPERQICHRCGSWS